MATVIINHPTNVHAPIGDTALFTVEATGESLTYTWQYRNKGGTSWLDSPLSTADTPTLSVPVTETHDGMSYRCMITDAGGEIVFTDVAYLFVLRNGTLEYDTVVGIADAIRAKLNSEETMLPSEMAGLIESIAAGYEVVTGEIVSASNQTSISVDHGLGRTPVIAVIFPQLVPYTNPVTGFVSDFVSGSTMQLTAYFIDGVGNGTYSEKTTNGTQFRKGGTVTANDTTVVFSSYSNSPFYSSGIFPYKYVIVG